MAGQRLRYAAAVTAMLFSALALFVPPMISGQTINYVIKGLPMSVPGPVTHFIEQLGGRGYLAHNLWLCALGILVFATMGGVLGFLKDRWTALASESITLRLRDSLYDHLQRLPCSYHDKAPAGDLVQRCTSDVETIKGFLGLQAVEITRVGMMLLCMVPFMLALSGRLTVVAMSLMPVVMLFSLIFFKRVRRAFRVADEAEGQMTAVLQENLTGIRVVRAFARQDFECGKFATKNDATRDAWLKLLRLMAWYWSSSDLLCHLQNVLLLVCGAYWIMNGTVAVGTLFTFIVYENMLLWPLRGMGRTLTELGKATVSLERLQEILEHPLEEHNGASVSPASEVCVAGVSPASWPAKPLQDEIHATAANDENNRGQDGLETRGRDARATSRCPRLLGEISVRDLSFSFDGQAKVLDGISFDVQPGQTLAILGASGSGKSVLVHLLLRFYDYTEGSIKLDGHELRDLDRAMVRSQVSVVLQEPFLYSKTLRDNIRLGHSVASQSQLEDAAQAACVHDSIMQFEQHYETLVGERGVTLSGGQRQRVALARAIVRNPDLLILDDSLSAVDTRTEAMILSALRQRHGRRTTILISHRLSALRQADQIMVLEHGHVAQRGTHEQLLRQEGLYARLWRIQSSLEEDLTQEMGAPVHVESEEEAISNDQ